MKKLTNTTNLPQALFDAVTNDGYRGGGDISVTTLIDAPQIRLLKKQNDITEDVSERIWALFGSAVHMILERANIKSHQKRAFLEVHDELTDRIKAGAAPDMVPTDYAEKDAHNKKQARLQAAIRFMTEYIEEYFPEVSERYIFEQRLFWDVNGIVISGQFDIFDHIDGILYDYKVCSTYAYSNPESKSKWSQQMNIYVEMLRMNGYNVKRAVIVAIFRDFSSAQSIRDKNYPRSQVEQIEIPLIPSEKLISWVQARVELHRQADLGNVIPCDGKERWATATNYAVKAYNSKVAIAGTITDNKALAEKFIKENSHRYVGLFVETRPGQNRRCESYCPVRSVCPQRKQAMEDLKREAVA